MREDVGKTRGESMTEPQARRVAVTRRGSGGARAVVTPAPPTRDPIYVTTFEDKPRQLGGIGPTLPTQRSRSTTGTAHVHKLDGDAAARVHEAHCAAPPACGCTPVLVEVPDPSFPKTVLGN